MLELVGLGEQASRYPHQMSGGQQQRVALARALAIEPACSSSTSRCPRSTPRSAASSARRSAGSRSWSGITTLFVTHDQEEALAMGDRVGVMSAGRLEQIAPPAELYDRPRTPVRGRVRRPDEPDSRDRDERDGRSCWGRPVPLLEGSVQSGPVQALIRPENVRLVRGGGRARRAWPPSASSDRCAGPR